MPEMVDQVSTGGSSTHEPKTRSLSTPFFAPVQYSSSPCRLYPAVRAHLSCSIFFTCFGRPSTPSPPVRLFVRAAYIQMRAGLSMPLVDNDARKEVRKKPDSDESVSSAVPARTIPPSDSDCACKTMAGPFELWLTPTITLSLVLESESDVPSVSRFVSQWLLYLRPALVRRALAYELEQRPDAEIVSAGTLRIVDYAYWRATRAKVRSCFD